MSSNVLVMLLVMIRHAQSVENADKYKGFYQDRRPYSGAVAHEISRRTVGLTPIGFRESVWLGEFLTNTIGSTPHVYTSTYRRAIDTAAVAFPGLPDGWPRQTPLLDEQHYGDATYMTKAELFATYPEGAGDRRSRKHLWVPPGGGESLADGVLKRIKKFIVLMGNELHEHHVVAITHHTAILAVRTVLERRPLTEVVTEARKAKVPTAGVLSYGLSRDGFKLLGLTTPPIA